MTYGYQTEKTTVNSIVNSIQKPSHSTNITLKTRIRICEAYVSSIFLYTSKVWTLTKALEKTIDVFQRNLIRKILDIWWPYKINNKILYKHTKQEPWSQNIKRRRLRWLGHLMRLPIETPVQQALQESLRPTKRLLGKPKSTWISWVNQDQRSVNQRSVQSSTSALKHYRPSHKIEISVDTWIKAKAQCWPMGERVTDDDDMLKYNERKRLLLLYTMTLWKQF